MTDTTMSLRALLDKSPDAECSRAMVGSAPSGSWSGM